MTRDICTSRDTGRNSLPYITSLVSPYTVPISLYLHNASAEVSISSIWSQSFFCTFSVIPPYHIFFWSLHSIVSDWLSFIPSYHMSISLSACFPHLPCNVYHSMSSFDSSLHNVWPAPLRFSFLRVHLNLASFTLSAMSTSSHLVICSSHDVWLSPFHILSGVHTISTFSVISTAPHLLISSFHVSDQLSFISSYYVSIPSQPCFPHLLCNVYHLTSSDLFIP